MPSIEREVLEDISAGSFEHIKDIVAELASEKMGEDVEIIATHPGHAIGFAEGRVVKIGWSTENGSVSVSGISDADVPVVTEANTAKHVSDRIQGVVKALCSEEFDQSYVRNQLHFISSLVKSGGEYWAEDIISEASESLSEQPDWLSEYRLNMAQIRGALYGVLGETESVIPTTRYHRVKRTRMESFRPEIYDSTKIIARALGQMVESLSPLVFDKSESCGVSLNNARDAIIGEAHSLFVSTRKILELARPEALASLAKYHDDLAERSKQMLVVSRFLSRASEPAQTGV